MNCRRRSGSSPSIGNSQMRADPSNKGNGTATYGDKAGMERGKDNTVTKEPEWDGKAMVVESSL